MPTEPTRDVLLALRERDEHVPAMVFSLAEILGDEMAVRGWTIEDAGGRMGIHGSPRDTLCLAAVMAVQHDNLLLDDEFIDGIARAFDVSAQSLRRIHQTWLEYPATRQPYEVPNNLFGPWLRAALAGGQTHG